MGLADSVHGADGIKEKLQEIFRDKLDNSEAIQIILSKAFR
jgi:hypothetical protein